MSAFIRLSVILVISAPLVTGCGQKGPLFLPGDPSAIRSTTPVTAPAGGTETDEDDEDDETPPAGH